MILMIDNYDSFTYNLVQYLQIIGTAVHVERNDRVSIEDIRTLAPEAIVLSPGPGRPEAAGICLDVIRTFSGKLPILGVCLGHQAIGMAFGASITHARQLMHGKVSTVTADGKAIYRGVRSPFTVMRYHSLAVSRESLPDCLAVTAQAEDGEIMGLRHKTFFTEGIQFHPESIMTPVGKRLLRNFLRSGTHRQGG